MASGSVFTVVVRAARTALAALSLVASGAVPALAEPDYATLYAELSPAVVTVRTLELSDSPRRAPPTSGVGTGFFIELDLVMTAAHVVGEADHIRVRTADGRVHRADLVSVVESSDVALLRVAGREVGAPVVRMGDFDAARIGEPLFIIGAPFGLERTLSVGYLSGKSTRALMVGGAPVQLLQTDAAINPGNSGGPVFDRHGEVIGVVSFIFSRSGRFDGVGFATSIETAYEALMNSSGFWAGFEGVVLNDELAELLNLPAPGILVQRVARSSVAARSGLRAGRVEATIGDQKLRLGGDVILEINGLVCVEPHDFRALSEAARAMRPDRGYVLKVFRQGRELTLLVEDDSRFIELEAAPATTLGRPSRTHGESLPGDRGAP